MLFQAIVLILARLQEVTPKDREPTILVYPDDREKKIAFNITLDEDICKNSFSKIWKIFTNAEIIFQNEIESSDGSIQITYNKSLRIESIQDIGKSLYYPIVCDVPFYEFVIKYDVLYRPNYTISMESKSFRRDDDLMITGHLTDWDSTKLSIETKINNKKITNITVEKEISSDPVPFSIHIPLNTSQLEENNFSIIVTDDQGLSSNISKIFHINAVRPHLSFPNNAINESFIKGNNITINISVDDHDVTDFIKFYFSIDDQKTWKFIKNMSLINHASKPSLSINPNITEGNHSIYVKCIDSNGLESESYLVKIVSISQPKSNEESNSSKDAMMSSMDTPNNTTSNDDDGSPAISFIIMLPSIAAIFAAVFINFYCNKRHEKSSDYSNETEIIIGPELKADLGSEIETLFSLNDTTFDYFNSEVDSLIDLQSHEPDS